MVARRNDDRPLRQLGHEFARVLELLLLRALRVVSTRDDDIDLELAGGVQHRLTDFREIKGPEVQIRNLQEVHTNPGKAMSALAVTFSPATSPSWKRCS